MSTPDPIQTQPPARKGNGRRRIVLGVIALAFVVTAIVCLVVPDLETNTSV